MGSAAKAAAGRPLVAASDQTAALSGLTSRPHLPAAFAQGPPQRRNPSGIKVIYATAGFRLSQKRPGHERPGEHITARMCSDIHLALRL